MSQLTSTPMTPIVHDIDEDIRTTFNREKWVKAGKKIQDVPLHVSSAHTQALAIPAAFLSNLPDPSLPIIDFIQLDLPKESSAILTTRIDKWFSHDIPQNDVTQIASRMIPPRDDLLKLQQASQQAWLDGALSLTDPRFNQEKDRFPLWIITYWIKMSDIIRARLDWVRAREWIEDESQGTRFPDGFGTSTEIFGTIGWNVPLTHLGIPISSRNLCQLLSTRWLCDDIMELLIMDLQTRLRRDQTLASKVIIPPSQFYRLIEKTREKGYHADTLPRSLKTIEDLVKTKGRRFLYLAVFVGGNHEIAVYIDFLKRTFGWGAKFKPEI
jgi:hypothetical protein